MTRSSSALVKESRVSENMNAIKRMLWPLGVRETFSYLGMEPELLKTLFGDPTEYNVIVCSGDSLAHLLRRKDRMDILIGTCYLLKIMDDDQGAQFQDEYRSELFTNCWQGAAVRLNREFKRKYQGPGIKWLEEGLQMYMEMYNSDMHYGKTIHILQSSGTGKSRLVAELGKSNPEERWGISICFRGVGLKKSPEANEGWPLGDVPVCEFLSSGPSLPVDNEFRWRYSRFMSSEEIAAAFMGALFSVLHDTIVDARRGRSHHEAKKAFDHSWSVPDVTRPADSPRNGNFEKVRIKANLLLITHRREVLEAREFPGGVSSRVGKLFSALVEQSAKDLDEGRRALGLACFTFAFDESGLLNFSLESYRNPRAARVERITLLAMQRIIKACEGFEFWFFMPDTRFGLHEVYHAEDKDTPLKWRNQDDFRPLPPWPNLPFNALVPHPDFLPKTPFEALCLNHLRVYGRPLWMLYKEAELMNLAAVKLLCGPPQEFLHLPSEKYKLQVLAVHSSRFILNLSDTTAANTMAIASVRAHMRFLIKYNLEKRVATSEVLSEPILAIAAGKLLLDDKDKYKKSMQILVEDLIISDKIISLGDRWETVARMILIVNRDATVHAAGGQICILDFSGDTQKITANGGTQRYLEANQDYAVRPFTLDSYLRNLVDPAKISQLDGAFDSGLDWATGVHMNFTHFVQLEDFVGPYLSSEFLIACWRKGYALQFISIQPIIDMLLIGYRGDLHKPFDHKMFVFVALQVRNRVKAAELELINTITCPFLRICSESENWKPEYMVILMDMGTSAHFKDSGGQVHITKQAAAKGEAWFGFQEAKEYPAVRISIRGLEPYISLAEWAPAILDLQRPRKREEMFFSTLDDALASNLRFAEGALTLPTEEIF